MLHPKQFEVNEAWILFRLNGPPIHTEEDGDFNCVALMDAASCFILGMEMAPLSQDELTAAQFRNLLKTSRAHKQQLPRTLFIPKQTPAAVTTREAIAKGIDVISIDESELLVFIREARESFAEHMQEKGGASDA